MCIVVQCFHESLKEVAPKFGMGLTKFKQKCRDIGIKPWPSRALATIDNNMKSLTSGGNLDIRFKVPKADQIQRLHDAKQQFDDAVERWLHGKQATINIRPGFDEKVIEVVQNVAKRKYNRIRRQKQKDAMTDGNSHRQVSSSEYITAGMDKSLPNTARASILHLGYEEGCIDRSTNNDSVMMRALSMSGTGGQESSSSTQPVLHADYHGSILAAAAELVKRVGQRSAVNPEAVLPVHILPEAQHNWQQSRSLAAQSPSVRAGAVGSPCNHRNLKRSLQSGPLMPAHYQGTLTTAAQVVQCRGRAKRLCTAAYCS
eukprot:jgi/Chrzof1/2712/Cz11g26060.t1